MTRVAVVSTHFRLPFGQGASGRIREFARSLVELGVDLDVICLRPTESGAGSLNNRSSGELYGAKFLYPGGQLIYSKYRVIRYIQNFKAVIMAILVLFDNNRQRPYKAIWIYGTDSLFYSFVFFLLAKFLGAKYIGETTEAPFVYEKNSVSKKIRLFVYEKVTSRLFDGLVVISSFLKDYYRNKLKVRSAVVIIPPLLSPDFFSACVCRGHVDGPPSLAYVGSLNDEREIENVFEVYNRCRLEIDGLQLKIIGISNSTSISERLETFSRNSSIEEGVHLLGLLPAELLARELTSSSTLILPRIASPSSIAGFPNKLAEYLASGRPVVVTDVGDIGRYLVDIDSAYLIPSGDIEKFVAAVVRTFDFKEESSAVGLRGRAVARSRFDGINNARRLLKLMEV